MKALMCHAFGPIDTLRVEEVASPVPGPGQVLIDVKAAASTSPTCAAPRFRRRRPRTDPISQGARGRRWACRW